MAKKIVRGITDVKTINNQDFDTNNVNDLLSDGQYNYIHRKKGESDEYHNLTDNIKTISSDNTELLAVTNYNKTTNTALLSPKHDPQKEQVLESTRNTVTINHGENGTAEKTTVDTNPEKVLEHENLLTDYGISKKTTGNTTKLGLEYNKVEDGFDLNNLENGNVRGEKLVNSPDDGQWFVVSSVALGGGHYAIQEAVRVLPPSSALYKSPTKYQRAKNADVWSEWREQVGDMSVIDGLLAQKEQVLESTRNTVTINHGENGTAEKTTVDTNPLKVLEHENLISDSEYITLNHQQGENTTHIQTALLEQTLDSIISVIAGGGSTIEGFSWAGGKIHGTRHDVVTAYARLTTFTFQCDPQTSEYVIDEGNKSYFEPFFQQGKSISNGAITITNDGTTMKLINSGGSQNVSQQGTFTFYERAGSSGGGGGGVHPS